MNKTDKQKNLLRNNNSLIILLFVAYVITVISGVYIYKSTVLINSCDQNNLFIETSLTIIGILVTFVIGYQIYNAVELKQSIDDRFKAVSTLKDELNKLKSESEESLLFINIDALVNSYFTALGKYEYDIAIFKILYCINQRTKFESYISEYEIKEYSKCTVINYVKLCAYEFLLIDVICKIFTEIRESVSFKNSTITYTESLFKTVNGIFEHIHEQNIINSNEVFNKIYKLIKSADIKDYGYVYKREDVDSFIKYRSSFYNIHESDIICLYNDTFKEAKLPIDK